jgi:hypothetical protein
MILSTEFSSSLVGSINGSDGDGISLSLGSTISFALIKSSEVIIFNLD